MLRTTFALAACVTMLAVVSASADDIRRERGPKNAAAKNALEGKAPPAWHVTDWLNTKGENPQPTDFRGKVVLVDFWGVWCGPCRKAIPKLKAWQAKYGDDGLVIVGVHTTNAGERMAAYAEQQDITWPVAVDVDKRTTRAYQVDSYPDFYLIDRAGKLRYADVANTEVERAIERLLRESPDGTKPLAPPDAGLSDGRDGDEAQTPNIDRVAEQKADPYLRLVRQFEHEKLAVRREGKPVGAVHIKLRLTRDGDARILELDEQWSVDKVTTRLVVQSDADARLSPRSIKLTRGVAGDASKRTLKLAIGGGMIVGEADGESIARSVASDDVMAVANGLQMARLMERRSSAQLKLTGIEVLDGALTSGKDYRLTCAGRVKLEGRASGDAANEGPAGERRSAWLYELRDTDLHVIRQYWIKEDGRLVRLAMPTKGLVLEPVTGDQARTGDVGG